MKSKLTELSFAFILLFISIVTHGQYTLIPDSNFEQALIDDGIDTEGILDGQILTVDAEATQHLDLLNDNISDLTGIEAFIALVFLNCTNNDLTQLDVSSLLDLQTLRVNSNQLTSLDISSNTQLRTLYIINNNIASIDLGQNVLLENLILSQNPISTVDLSNNVLIEDLSIENTLISAVDLSGLTELVDLGLNYNDIVSIDLSDNPKLRKLDIRSNELTSIDFSANPLLDRIFIDGNQIAEVDVSMLPLLDYFICYNNLLTELDVSSNSVLRTFNCGGNLLETLDIRTGNNVNMNACEGANNPFLECVNVDDPVYSESNWTWWDEDIIFSTDCPDVQNCASFETAPVDVTKSFNPVNGVQDRVQLKWYKESPKVKFSDEDAAMCDIKAWAVRELDPVTGDVISIIQNPDTISLVDRKKTYSDDSPREIFKWPLFFSADGANNAKRVEPNTRYRFKVRCECGFSGTGLESPWSIEKTFNTPDFDPVTGINTAPPITDGESITKNLENDAVDFELYPNPTNGEGFNLRLNSYDTEPIQLQITDITGKVLLMRILIPTKESLTMHVETTFSQGVYFVSLGDASMAKTKRLVVR